MDWQENVSFKNVRLLSFHITKGWNQQNLSKIRKLFINLYQMPFKLSSTTSSLPNLIRCISFLKINLCSISPDKSTLPSLTRICIVFGCSYLLDLSNRSNCYSCSFPKSYDGSNHSSIMYTTIGCPISQHFFENYFDVAIFLWLKI